MTYDKESFTKGLLTGLRLGRPKPRYGPKIVTWADGTDAEIAAMVAALDAGKITIADTGWQIGDERVVPISRTSWWSAQNVTFVLMDSQHYDLVGGGKDHFVAGLKTRINTGSVGISINQSYRVSWSDCALRRFFTNGWFMNSLPQTFASCFKQFKVVSAIYNPDDRTGIQTTEDYFSIFAEKEIFGERTYSYTGEANALSQIAYYTDASKRKNSVLTWERSVRNYNYYCAVGWDYETASYAVPSSQNLTDTNGIAPFGCI